MAEPENPPPFPSRELEHPLQRAREVARQHSASAPDGGTGPGHHLSWDQVSNAFLDAQAAMVPGGLLGRHMMQNWPRYQHVKTALGMSVQEAKHLMVAETGATVEAVIAGFLPGLLDIVKWVGLGAVIGAGIGALGGPFDEITVPGGALAGAEIGLWVANSLALTGMVIEIAKNLGQFVKYAKDGAEIAWYAGDDPHVPLASDLADAAKLFAAAIAELWMALLQALVAEVLRRAGKYVGERLGLQQAIARGLREVADKIKGSKLGAPVAAWFEKHFEQIRQRLEERRRARAKQLGDSSQSQGSTTGGSGPGPSSSTGPAPAPRQPSFVHGQSDGGPGQWGPPSTPRTSAGADYQQQVTGAPPGTEYKVPLARRASGNVDFDGYDPQRNVLLDAKDYNNWPPANPPGLRQMAIDKILNEAGDQVEAANGTPIEWHVPTAAKANELSNIFANNGIQGIQVITTPK